MKRRHFIQGSAAAATLAAPAVNAQTARAKTLKVVPLTSLYSLDTVFNTSLVTTNHRWAVTTRCSDLTINVKSNRKWRKVTPFPTMAASMKSSCGRG